MDLTDIDNQPENDEYERFSEAEDFEDYKTDGYHPVNLGEIFKEGQYKIIQKLGWGQFSTVWLAKELPTGKFYALKIQKSKKSYGEAALDEFQLLESLQTHMKDPKWIQIIEEFNEEQNQKLINNKLQLKQEEINSVLLHDNFIHFGMHGKHFCSVFDVMGPTLLDVINNFEDNDVLMDIQFVKHITRQILIGLTYMHEVCGMIHTDLKPENVMIGLDQQIKNTFCENLQKYTKKPLSMKFLQKLNSSNSQKNKKKYDKKKQKKKQKKAGEKEENKENEKDQDQEEESKEIKDVEVSNVSTAGGSQGNDTAIVNDQIANQQEEEEWEDCTKQENLYTLIWKEDNIVELNDKLNFKLVDFGNACWVNKHFTERIQTREYRSPEAILQIDYNTNTDIWSLACLVFELLTNSFLFKPHKGEGYKKNEDHLNMMQETLGRIPKNLALSGKRSREFFNKNGVLLHKKNAKSKSISQILVKEFKFKKKDAQEIEVFLTPMLEFDPKKRIGAREVLKSEWLWK